MPAAHRHWKLPGMAKPLAKLVALLKPKRTWGQFSLGTLFVVVTAWGTWLAVFRVRDQELAILMSLLGVPFFLGVTCMAFGARMCIDDNWRRGLGQLLLVLFGLLLVVCSAICGLVGFLVAGLEAI